jgi:hypothetical protein
MLFGICVGVIFSIMISLLINTIKRRNRRVAQQKRLTRRRFSVPVKRPKPPEIEIIKEGE